MKRQLKLKLPYLIIGAEPIKMDIIKTFYSYFEGKIINTYGPTECAINNTYYYVDKKDKFDFIPIGKRLVTQDILLTGRNDNQLKIRGNRVEISEIEKALLSHPSIDDCIVVAKTLKEMSPAIKTCKKCHITSNYPGVKINSDNICNICDKFGEYKTAIDNYFKNPDELERLIKNKKK